MSEKELLIEIYSEEIPARMQQKASEDFKKIFAEFFAKQNIQIAEQDLKTFITPRRLVLLAKNLSEEQTSPAVNKIGPKTDGSDAAIQGFLKSVGVSEISKLEKITRDNGEYYLYKQPEIKVNTAEILEKNLPTLLQKMSGTWLKSMDLIDLEKQSNWVRPIRSILAIFGSKVLNFEFANLKSGNKTFGHLLAGKKSLQVTDFADYVTKLEENFVILDQEKRKEIIVKQIEKIAQELGLEEGDKLVAKNANLISEIVGLVEFPKVLLGKIDDEFIDLPPEVLALVIKNHQKALLCCKKSDGGKLLPHFIFVSNVNSDPEATKKIISDNEKVVRARLSDAKFYIEEDLKIPFESRTEALKNIIFHKKLGSLYAKVQRLEALSKFITLWVPKSDPLQAKRLALLSKNDLTTKTVAELTELQGIVGKYYAKKQKESDEIANAIAEQYLPNGQNSDLPKTPLGIVLALADKIDAICSLFLADEKPTASKDPFALRRAVLGIIKIIFENKISVPLKIFVDMALKNFSVKEIKLIYPDKSNAQIKEIKSKLSAEIIQFFVERNKVYLKEQGGLDPEVINQIFDDFMKSKNNKKFDLLLVSGKAIFVNQFMNNEANAKTIELYKRVSNIVAIEQKKDNRQYDGAVSIMALQNKHEKSLYKKAKSSSRLLKKALKQNDFEKAFAILSDLKKPIEDFFDNVEVNCEDKNLRENRLMILAKVKQLFGQVLPVS
ncbi:MAG: glycyl-tRNA synthetase beta chain [Rickettsiaceae bacterium]|jgi:glycyl-tRNA synthetase beta chain|nr:glycyl-tRNA synthetase beta chain [Rickettsiaceae bacterium]